MANTYTQIYLQVVFAVSSRQCLIAARFKDELFKYMTGIVRNEKQKLISIGGMPDHVHLLIGLQPDIALSDLVKTVKTGSSSLVNANRWVKGKFRWQEGFGAFSYSRSQIARVAQYIESQEAHHAKVTFRTEYLTLLRKFDIAFDDRYVFKWLDEE
jgi:REP element-mobilizing transposase RayT